MFRSIRNLIAGSKSTKINKNRFFKTVRMAFETLEDRTVPAAFTAGDLAVLQVAASVNNTTFSVVELNPTTANQTPTNTIAIDSTGANALRISGSATSTGYLSLTNDGSLLTFNAANTATTTGNINTFVTRGVGTLDPSGNFALPTTYSGSSGSQTRSSTSLDNSTWFIADQGGLYSNGTTAASPAGNYRSIRAFGGTVYVLQASATLPSVSTVSAATGGTVTALPGLSDASANNQDFYLIKSGDNGAAYDVLYTLNATSAIAGTISKYSLVSGSWTANGTYTTNFGGFGLSAADNGSGALLYLSTGTGATVANSVIELADAAGYNSPINITTAANVTLYTAPAGTIVKGVAFAPVTAATTLPTTTTVSATPASPSVFGTSVSFTASIGSVALTLNVGTVTFYAGPGLSNQIGNPVNVVMSVATSDATTTLPAGTNTITAVYSGGGNFGPSQGTTTYVVNQAPSFTSDPNTTFFLGSPGTFLVTATGDPAPTLSLLSGPLPTGVTFVSGVLSGTPTQSGTFPLTFKATNGIGPDAIQNFTLSVNSSPVFSSVPSATFAVGAAGTFHVTATGTPTPTISLASGTLPTGVTFVNGLLSGTPAAGMAGTYPLVFSAMNTGGTVTQDFTLTVTPGAFTPGNLVLLQAGTGSTGQTTGQLYLNEMTTAGANVQQVVIPNNQTVGGSGNQPIVIDLSSAAGNGQLTRSYDGAALTFGGLDAGLNSPVNGGKTVATGSADRVLAIVRNDPTAANFLNTTTHGQFYVGDDNRGGVAVTADGPLYSVGHPNQAGGAVSNGVHYFGTTGPSIGTQTSASQNIRGGSIGFDKRFYGTTAGMISAAGNVAGIFTEINPLPTDADANPARDIQVVPALFTASKLGGVTLADMNGDGITDNGDRLYFVDDGTVGGVGTGGVYVATWNDAITTNAWNSSTLPYVDHWSLPVRLGDAPAQDTNVGNLRGITSTVISPTEVDLYTTAFDNKANHFTYVQQWVDTGAGVAIANAQILSGTTVQITTLTPNNYLDGETVVVDGVGATNGAGALTQGYNGRWTISVIDSTHFTYTDTNANATSLPSINNQGAANRAVTPTTILALPNSTNSVGTSVVAAVGLRGVAFAPVSPTSVALAQSPANPLTPGTDVTLTATLTNTQVASLSGRVAFIDQNNNTVLGFGNISGNQASLTVTGGLIGNHYVSAYFAGGGTLALASAASNTIQVVQAGTTTSTTLASSDLSAAAIGRTIALTATVTGGSVSGTVSFYSGSVALANLLGNSALSGGVATLTTAFGTAGAKNIIAVYNGDAVFASSQGTTTVNVAANATVSVTSSANNVAIGSVQTYTATINGNATLGIPTGTVVFNLVAATNTAALGAPAVTATSSAITLVPGAGNTATAVWTGPALTAPGSYFITVSYSATGATNPYSAFATDTKSSVNGVAFIETVKQSFTPGNLIAVQRGDGTSNLGSNGYLTFLVEYTPAGTLIQKIAMPNIDSGSSHALLLSGQDSDEGLLNRSADGYSLSLIGYDVPVGKTFVTSTFPFQFGRTIASVNGSASVDTSTIISTTTSSSSPFVPLAAVSNDGNEFWITSNLNTGNTTDTGIQYVSSLGATTASTIGPIGQDASYLGIVGGNLYASANNTVSQVGAGLPTGASTLSSLNNLTAAYAAEFPGSKTPKQFLFLNSADGTSNNPDIVYIADQVNGLLKFFKDSTGAWQAPSSFGQKLIFAGGATGVVGYLINPGTASASIQLYVTGSNVQGANPNQIASFLDLNGAPLGSGGNSVDNGFTPGNFTVTAFVGLAGNPAGPNGNMNFAGMSFAPGYVTGTALAVTGSGANRTFTATVTTTGVGTPDGVVVFSVDGTVVGQGTVDGSGVATLSVTTFPTGGPHSIVAAYQGSVKFGTSSASQSTSVATTTVLDATPNASTGGTLVTFTATVAPSPGAAGTVNFLDNGSALPGGANVPVVGGVASFQISTLSAATHPITAVYSGDAPAGYLGSTSNEVDYVVTANVTTTTITNLSPNPATTAQSFSFTVTVSGGISTDGETVVIKDASNGNSIVPTTGGPLSGGSEILTVAAGALSVGPHQLYAVYGGDNFNAGSQSSQVLQTITSAATPPQLVGSPVVNGGSAYAAFAGPQRSDVVSLQLAFDQPVTLDAGAYGMAVHTNNQNLGAIPTFAQTSPDGGLTWIISFTGANTDPTFTDPTGALFGPGAPANGFRSLADGVYDFTVNLANVHLVSDPSVAGTGSSTSVISRLFGNADTTGEVSGVNHTATVNTADNLLFRAAFNTPASYQPYFDFNGDGQINTTDNLQFRNRFNRPLSWTE